MIKKIISALLVVAMLLSVLSSCRRDPDNDTSTDPPSTDNSSGNNNNNNDDNKDDDNGEENPPVVQEKNPYLDRIFRFSSEELKLASAEKDGIVNYLIGLGAITPNADENVVNEALNALAFAHRHNVLFTTLNTLSVVSEDYAYQ